jgi:LmbE family N-acetylglucosaminyl deacetylase
LRGVTDASHPPRPTVVFFHAHPDDEAIFTGGTIARLATGGVRVVVVIATSGEQGVHHGGEHPLADHRAGETAEACRLLGVERLELLGFSDSGIAGPGAPMPDDAFALADVEHAAQLLSAIIVEERADALVYYDEGGIYGHADHLAVHRVGRRAGELAGVTSVYEATVDREYLHFVETHLVGLASLSMHEPVPAGVPTVLVSTTIDVTSVIDVKRAAIAAHASQIPPDSHVLQFDAATFSGVYGYEWYVRTGPPGVLDMLAM